MVLLSTNNLHRALQKKKITVAHYAFYSFICFSSIFQSLNTTKYMAVDQAYQISSILGIVNLLIHLFQFVVLYKMAIGKDLGYLAISMIPVFAIVTIRVSILVLLPLAGISLLAIYHFNLDFSYWNVVNSAVVATIATAASTVMTLSFFRRYLQAEKLDRVDIRI